MWCAGDWRVEVSPSSLITYKTVVGCLFSITRFAVRNAYKCMGIRVLCVFGSGKIFAHNGIARIMA